MIRVFKAIREKQLEAKAILEEAIAQAEKLKNQIEKEALNVYDEAYKKTLIQAEKKATDLKRQTAKDAENELAKLLSIAEDQAQRIEAKAKKNFKKAVDSVLIMILH